MSLGLPRIWDEYFPGGGGGFNPPNWQGYGGGPHGYFGPTQNEPPYAGTYINPAPSAVPAPWVVTVTPSSNQAPAPAANVLPPAPAQSVDVSFLDRVAGFINDNPVAFGLGGVGFLLLAVVVTSKSR